ncbi:hypothetical protein PV10_02055 [Exophiala mesophila]|uniref:Uncharacterized protein n=1 Tax=Exophiala mesophila TaxID=212818 RepID=A0A0D2A5H9_EXOME|nr:uncharacterized protein PV10_02055 [Exophiala mesophila]KIV94273.1 hypothetical protein PV10_02055 [Exophiala mesophila]
MAIFSSALLLRTHSLTLLTISFYLIFSPSQVFNSTPVWLLGEAVRVRSAAFASEDGLSDSPLAPPIMPGARQRNAGPGAFEPPRLAGAAATSPLTSPVDQGTRELCALLALLMTVYAVMQFIFAGDLTLLPSNPSTSTNHSSKTLKPTSTSLSSPSSSSTSSRYGEELHTLYSAQSRWLTLSGLRVFGSSILVAWIYVFYSHGKETLGFSGLGLLANRVTFTLALSDMLFWGYLWTVLKDEARHVAIGVARKREAEEES